MAKAFKIDSIPEDQMPRIETQLAKIETSIQFIQVEIAKINTRLDTELPHLATKAELAEMYGKLDAKNAIIEGKLEARITEVEGKLEAKIEKSRNTVIVWVVGLYGFWNSELVSRFCGYPSFATHDNPI